MTENDNMICMSEERIFVKNIAKNEKFYTQSFQKPSGYYMAKRWKILIRSSALTPSAVGIE